MGVGQQQQGTQREGDEQVYRKSQRIFCVRRGLGAVLYCMPGQGDVLGQKKSSTAQGNMSQKVQEEG